MHVIRKDYEELRKDNTIDDIFFFDKIVGKVEFPNLENSLKYFSDKYIYFEKLARFDSCVGKLKQINVILFVRIFF